MIFKTWKKIGNVFFRRYFLKNENYLKTFLRVQYVTIMDSCRLANYKPLRKSMMVYLAHICVDQSQSVKVLSPGRKCKYGKAFFFVPGIHCRMIRSRSMFDEYLVGYNSYSFTSWQFHFHCNTQTVVCTRCVELISTGKYWRLFLQSI